MKYLSILITMSALCFLLAWSSCTEFLARDASSLSLSINSPSDSLYTADSVFSFWWEALPEAEQYRYQLVTPAFDQSPFLLIDTTILENRLNLELEEGRYGWRIRVENAGSESPYQTYGLTVDRTAPNAAQAIFPLDNDTLQLGNEALLQWTSSDPIIGGLRAPTTDSLYLYRQATSGQTNLLATELETGIFQYDISTLLPAAVSDTVRYTWTIASYDRAGNSSQRTFSFLVK